MTRRDFCLVTALLALPALAVAHPGHAHRTMGVVSSIHEHHLEVKDTQGKSTTFTLNEKTRVRRGKSVMRISDIKAGDRVVVVHNETKDEDGKTVITVTEVQVGTATS